MFNVQADKSAFFVLRVRQTDVKKSRRTKSFGRTIRVFTLPGQAKRQNLRRIFVIYETFS